MSSSAQHPSTKTSAITDGSAAALPSSSESWSGAGEGTSNPFSKSNTNAALPTTTISSSDAVGPGPSSKTISNTLATAALRRSVTAGAGGPPRPPFLSNPNRQHSQPHTSTTASGQQQQQPPFSSNLIKSATSFRIGVGTGGPNRNQRADEALPWNDMNSAVGGDSGSATDRSSSSPRRTIGYHGNAKRSSSLPSKKLAAAISSDMMDFDVPPPPPSSVVGTNTDPMIAPNSSGKSTTKKLNMSAKEIEDMNNVNIEIGTPADMALRANAGVKVTRFDKMSRRLQIPQTIHAVKKTSSSLAHVGLKGKKPPRIPNVEDDEVLSVGSVGGGIELLHQEDDLGPLSPGASSSGLIRGAYSADDADDMMVVPTTTENDSTSHYYDQNVHRSAAYPDGTGSSNDDPATSIWRCASDPAPPPSLPILRSVGGEVSSPSRVRFDNSLLMPTDQTSTSTTQIGSRSYSTAATTSTNVPVPAPLASRNSSQGSRKHHRRVKTDSSYVSSSSRSDTKIKHTGSIRSIVRKKQAQKHHVDQVGEGHLEGEVAAGGAAITTESIVKKPFVYKRSKKRKGDPTMRSKSYVKGKVIDGEHELYALSIAVMLGLKTSIGKTNQELKLSQHQRLKARAMAKRETTQVGFNQEEVFTNENGAGTVTVDDRSPKNKSAEGIAQNRTKKRSKFRRKRQSSTLGRGSSTDGVRTSIAMSMNSAKTWLNKMNYLPGSPSQKQQQQQNIELTDRSSNADGRGEKKGEQRSSADQQNKANATVATMTESSGTLKEEEDETDAIWLDSDDFMAVEKYVFRPEGGPETPAHKLNHTFKFKDYSPKAFAYIRRLFGINEYEFLASVCGNASFIEFISNAKSGQFFFYSSDGKYMIKTMTTTESKFLRRILPHYFRHCCQSPDTLITKFFGMYRVKLYHLRRNVKFIIMNSVFDTDKYISSFFDVKGSKLGRDAKPGEMVKKDNDIRKTLPQEGFVMNDDIRARMRAQIVSDCQFLESMKIMDYSMLIGVHRIPPSKQHETLAPVHSSAGGKVISGRLHINTNRSMGGGTITNSTTRSIIQSTSGDEGSNGMTFKTGEHRTNGIPSGADSISQVVTNVSTAEEAETAPGDASVLTEDSRTMGEDESITTTTTMNMNDTTIDQANTTFTDDVIGSSNMVSKSRLQRSSSDTTGGPLPPSVALQQVQQSHSFRGGGAVSSYDNDVYYEFDEDESSYLEGSSAQMDRFSSGTSRYYGSMNTSLNADVTFLRRDSGYDEPPLLSPQPSIRKIHLDSAALAMSAPMIPNINSGHVEGGAATNRTNNTTLATYGARNSNGTLINPSEIRKELATEQMYWPFHRFYNIQGWRRMEPMTLGGDSGGAKSDQRISLMRGSAANNGPVAGEYPEGKGAGDLPIFVKPISDRKDKGLVMNVNRLKVILDANNATTSKQVVNRDEQGQPIVEPKIFYMGIIDVLQQFNLRKRAEAKLRRAQGGGWADASCVHPDVYARRFVEFFDEYTLAKYGSNGHARIDEHEDEHEESSSSSNDNRGNNNALYQQQQLASNSEVPYEQIVFFKEEEEEGKGGATNDGVDDTTTQAVMSPTSKSKKAGKDKKTSKKNKGLSKLDNVAVENNTTIEVTLSIPSTPNASS